MIKIKKKQAKIRMHVKQNDMVKIIAGEDKGKVGKVLKLLKQNSTIIVEGINMKFKHIKPRKEGDLGQIKQFESPIHSSNVMLYDQETSISSRIAHKIDENNGRKVRFLIKNKKPLV